MGRSTSIIEEFRCIKSKVGVNEPGKELKVYCITLLERSALVGGEGKSLSQTRDVSQAHKQTNGIDNP